MSMDKLLRADEQEYVSKPFLFSDFAAQAVAAYAGMEETTNTVRRAENQSAMDHVNQMLAMMKEPAHEEYNFDVEEGQDHQAAEDKKLRTLELLQHERDRRLNKQNKSIALRAMKYDFMDPALLAQRKRGEEAMEHWRSILSGKMEEEEDDGERLVNEHGEVLPRKKKVYCSREQAEEFLNAAPTELRSEHLPWAKGDIIVHASVYLGYSRSLEYHEVRLGRLMKVTDRLLLSGQSTLLDLKKAFHCPADYMVLDDVSKRNICQDDLCKNRFPSSFFFIHDTFYADINPEGSIDISLPIREWASSRPSIGEVKVKFMDDKKLCNLFCRLGQPYVYVHQGNCEHLVVFTDLHLRSVSDPVGPYPIRLRERAFRRITCAACGNDGAEWSVMDCEMLPGTPTYMCDKCYREFLFFDDGRKRCDFKAVPYFDRKAMDDAELFLSKLQIKPCKKPMKIDITLDDKKYGKKEEEKEGQQDCTIYENNNGRVGFDDLFAAAASTFPDEEEDEPMEEESEPARKKSREGYEEDSDDMGSDEWESGTSDDSSEESEDSDDESDEENGENGGEEMQMVKEEEEDGKGYPAQKNQLNWPDDEEEDSDG